tara:strand:- start:228 stop:1037 length:810 start_codon:yes stop_codon:yes gene_type:complete
MKNNTILNFNDSENMNTFFESLSIPTEEHLQDLVNSLNKNDEPTIRWVKRASGDHTIKLKKVGIFSASFNPLTIAHEQMMKLAHKKFQLDEIILLLARNNVDKSVFGFSLSERLRMMAAYVDPLSNYSVALSSHGRFIDKIKALKQELPQFTEYNFIIGYDTLVRIFDSKYYKDPNKALKQLFGQCRLVVANRSTFNKEDISSFLLNWPDFVPFVDFVELEDCYTEISSTEIRQRLESGHSVDHLVPSIIEFFLNNRIKSKRPIKPNDS